jgi:hypothetical protein
MIKNKIKKQIITEYLNILPPFKKEVTEKLISGTKAEKLATHYAKKNNMSLRVAKAHVSRAEMGLIKLQDGLSTLLSVF